MVRPKKTYIYLILPIILLISGLSTWRSLAIWGFQFSNAIGLLGLALTLCFAICWVAGLYVIWLINKGKVLGWLTTLVGATLFSLLGFLWMTPAGFSRVTIELLAENVWKPDIFTATWAGAEDGLDWFVPFSLPTNEPVPANLELVAFGPESGASGEIWLLVNKN